MSIILKGIDLPKEGEKITLAIFHDGDIVSYKYWLPKDAQAIQIPKDHGNIIDSKDILIPVRCIPKTIGLTDRAQEKIDEIIENAPTILEAEE